MVVGSSSFSSVMFAGGHEKVAIVLRILWIRSVSLHHNCCLELSLRQRET